MRPKSSTWISRMSSKKIKLINQVVLSPFCRIIKFRLELKLNFRLSFNKIDTCLFETRSEKY